MENITTIINTSNIIQEHLEPIVLKVRKEMSEIYDITKSEYAEYAGLCNVGCAMFKFEIQELAKKYDLDIKTMIIHGEQRHNHRIKPDDWYIQHTWISVYGLCLNENIYVDLTSQQFKYLYDDIPDYYISTTPPPWYMPDKENGFFKIYDFNKWIAIHIIENIDYHIWGGICKLYNKLLKINKKNK
jgi:hypothetical protein